LTLITKGPVSLFLTTVISTFVTSPIDASLLCKSRPASMPANFTVSPARTFDSGLLFSSSIDVISLTYVNVVTEFLEFVRQIKSVFTALGDELDKTQKLCNYLRTKLMFGFARRLLGNIRLDTKHVDKK